MHFQLNNHKLFKKLHRTNLPNTKQFPAVLSPRSIPPVSLFWPKIFHPLMLFCCLHWVCAVLPSTKHLSETLEMGEKTTKQPNVYSFLPPEKSSLLNLLPSLSKVCSTPSNNSFHKINLYKLHLYLESFLLYYLFNFNLYLHTCHANFD